MASVPWPIDELNGIHVGSHLDELLIRRFNLCRQKELEEDDGYEWWQDPEGEVSVVVYKGFIALVNHRDLAVIGGSDLINLDQFYLADMIGPPDRVDLVDGEWTYEYDPWELSVGFSDGRVSSVSLLNDKLLDD